MMPGGHANNSLWGSQWFQPTSFGSDQIQGITDMNALQLLASQQFSNVYGAGYSTFNNTSQWAQQWQPNNQANWGNAFAPSAQQPPPPPPPNTLADHQQLPPLPLDDPPSNSAAVPSEEERNFDAQFKEWEEKFQLWKEENKHHPDKTALAVYEAQWKSWREHLIQNREKLRKHREESTKPVAIAPISRHGIPESNQSSQTTVRSFPQSSTSCEMKGDHTRQKGLHPQLQQMSNLSGQPLVNLPQHNLYQNHIAQASSSSSTKPIASGHSSTNRFEGGGDHNFSTLKVKELSSDNSLYYRSDNLPRQFHDEYREQQVQHSKSSLEYFESPEQSFCPPTKGFDQVHKNFDPLFIRSNQNHPDHNIHDSWQRQRDPSSSSHPDDYLYENRQQNQSIVPTNQRELNIPQGVQPITRGMTESSHVALKYSRSENCDLPSFPVESSNETAASLFRKRALRGKVGEQRFTPYKVPELPYLDRRAVSDSPNLTGNARPRIEERLAEHADIKLTVIPPRVEKEPFLPLVRDYGTPVTNAASVLEPIVFEYNHRPGRNGRFAVSIIKPFSIDYAHGKSSRIETESKVTNRMIETEVIAKEQDVLTVNQTLPGKIPIEKSPVKVAPPPLFPSAAAIEENPPPQLQLLPDPAIESIDSAQLKVIDLPKTIPAPVEMEVVMVEDLLLPPGRYGRPSKIVVILRGLPGSGKSHLARLIKEKEVLMGGSAPRILSIDDYYLMDDGSSPVPWLEDQEEQYRLSLLKSFKRNLDDGHFSFVIVDALHAKVSEIQDIHIAARSRAFAVFLVDLPDNSRTGITRKCTEKDLEKMKNEWQKAPDELLRLDIRWLLQETVDDRIPTPDDVVTSTTALLDEDSRGSSNETPAVSKWEMMEQTEEKLDRLDGIVKRKLEKPASMEDWLQSGLPDDYDERKCIEGKKRVRWADVEEKIQQKKIRDLGFVVGQTDWSRMTDPTFGESALTKTKYI